MPAGTTVRAVGAAGAIAIASGTTRGCSGKRGHRREADRRRRVQRAERAARDQVALAQVGEELVEVAGPGLGLELRERRVCIEVGDLAQPLAQLVELHAEMVACRAEPLR